MDDSVPPNKECAAEMEDWSHPALSGVVFRSPLQLGKIKGS